MKKLHAILFALTLLGGSALAADEAPKEAPKGSTFGSKGYVWGQMNKEWTEATKLGGDLTRGKAAFRGCRGCHKPDGAGVLDGTYPRLSGQHIQVILKQATEVRAGVRVNPKMEPFSADHAVTVQELADIAIYLNSLTSSRENGKGPEDMSAKGRKLYEQNKCFRCHGRNGEGNEEKVYPVVASQHYGYLLREMKLIKSGTRGNSHPEMVKAIAGFSNEDLEAVADYLARLPDYRTVDPQGGKK